MDRRSQLADGGEYLVVERFTSRQFRYEAVSGERRHLAQRCTRLDVLSAVQGHRVANQLGDRAALGP